MKARSGVDPFAPAKRVRKKKPTMHVIECPPRMAKGRFRKGEGWRKYNRVDRGFMRGDRISTTEEALWLM